jgi:hypothetical protein
MVTMTKEQLLEYIRETNVMIDNHWSDRVILERIKTAIAEMKSMSEIGPQSLSTQESM